MNNQNFRKEKRQHCLWKETRAAEKTNGKKQESRCMHTHTHTHAQAHMHRRKEGGRFQVLHPHMHKVKHIFLKIKTITPGTAAIMPQL